MFAGLYTYSLPVTSFVQDMAEKIGIFAKQITLTFSINFSTHLF